MKSLKTERFKPNPYLEAVLLNLHDFATAFELDEKRVIEKQAALYVVREVLQNQNAGIFYEEIGKPFLKEEIKISISHSHDWLAVLFSYNNAEVGIDIEKVRDKILNIKHKFLSEDELKNTGNDTLALTLYWCAKEAVYKAFGETGINFAEEIKVQPFDISSRGGKILTCCSYHGKEKNYILHYQLRGAFALVFTDNES